MTDNSTEGWITATEAAERLNVKRETVYAYVSRGRIASRRSNDGRGRLLDPGDVERLANRTRAGLVKAGAPSERVESAITLIRDGELFYRGQRARDLATSWTFEQVADLIWGVEGASKAWTPSTAVVEIYRRVAAVLPDDALPVDMIRIAGSCLAAFDPSEPPSSNVLMAATARRVVATIVTALPPRSDVIATGTDESPLAAILWSRLTARQPTASELRLLNAAMIMLADHDLARSTIAIRTATRAGLDVGGLIRLGMDAAGGLVKGVASLAIESFLHNLGSADTVEVALNRRLKQGEPVPGFGHPVYVDGDPRAALILDLLRADAADHERLTVVEEVIRTQRDRGLPPPNAGFALAAMTYVNGMVPGAGETIFVVGRAVGWIAHAIEVLSEPALDHVQSAYVGPSPRR